jgi:hypothetical protein
MNGDVKFRILTYLLLMVFSAFLEIRNVSAENIDPNNQGLKYAYGENVGWINFKPSQGPGVTVTPSAVTGYAWGENIGWINLSPANGGVLNNGAGNLSGYAWGENVGWINFAPTGGGVQIDSQGFFIGKAWGENIGWISFNSTGAIPFGVRTSWLSQAPERIPTMTEWGMIILVILLGIGSIYYLRRRVAA